MLPGYSGLWAEIPLGAKGLFTDAGSSEIPYTNLIKANNINYTSSYLEKAPGAIRYNNVAFTSGIVGLIDYFPTFAQQRMLVLTADGKLWKDYGDKTFNNNSPIATGLGNGYLNNSCQMVIAGQEVSGNPKLVFIFSNGNSQIQVLSGDSNSVAQISLPASDWANANASAGTNLSGIYPRFGINHLSRLWVFSKSIAYASNPSNHQDFQTSNAILVNNVGPGDGGDIVGAAVYKGTLLVFKEGDIVYALNNSSVSSSNWFFYKFGEGFGISSIRGFAQVLDDLVIVNSNGNLTSYQATLKYGNITQGDIFKQAKVSKYFREYTDRSGISSNQSVFYPYKGVGLFTSKTTYKPNNDAIIQMDVADPQNPKFGLWNHYQADALALRRDPILNIPVPMYGGTEGYVYLADRADRAIAGSSYTGEFKTPYIDFRHMDSSLAQQNKLFDHLAVTFTPDGNHKLSVDVWIDGRFSETLNFSQTIDSNYLGSFVLGKSKLGVEEEQTLVLPLHGLGRRISFRGYNSNAYENFKVSLLSVGFRISGVGATSLGQH